MRNPDFGTQGDPGLNCFLTLGNNHGRFDFDIISYSRPGPFAMQGNYFYNVDTAFRLESYEDLAPLFAPGVLFHSDENPTGIANAFPVGKVLRDDLLDDPGIQILHPEVWVGRIHCHEDVAIFDKVRIVRAAKVFGHDPKGIQIVVASGRFDMQTGVSGNYYGSVEALGTLTEPIQFRTVFSNNIPRKWKGLCFAGHNSRENSILKYCNFNLYSKDFNGLSC